MTQTSEKIKDYTILGTLGQNREGGRITHLAQAPDGSKVVIKEFCFLGGLTWDEYSAIAQKDESVVMLFDRVMTMAIRDRVCDVREST